MPKPILNVINISKEYNNLRVLDNVTFEVRGSEIVGLLGPNGAGKTTTISIILGVLEKTSGKVFISDIDIDTHRSLALANTNFTASYAPLPGNLTVYENLTVFALLYGVKDYKARISELMERLKIQALRNTKYGALSSGEQSKINIAKALLNKPKLLLLDEPTSSLDPATARDIRNLIKEYAIETDCGVLWTSHNMYEVESVCDRVLLLSNGRIVLEGNPRELPKYYDKESLEELFIHKMFEG
ncbi:MAG: ABC transporter ATP-binding protein [Thermodesulfovibrionales bacterium]